MTSLQFDPKQKKIITWSLDPQSPLLVIAGAGTGKTRTLVGRVEYLLKNGALAKNILVLTFTQKACLELKQRMGELNKPPNIFTFHGLGQHLLNMAGNKIVPMSEVQYRNTLMLLARSQEFQNIPLSKLSLKLARALNQISWQDEGLIKAYELIKKEQQLFDYEDLIKLFIEGLKSEEITPEYKYIFVDEFQDATQLQLNMLKTLVNLKTQLFAVGDPRQAIYGFRGSYPDIFSKVYEYFPKITQLSLINNYRSSSKVIKAANLLFPELEALVGNNSAGEVKVVNVLSPYSMGEYIVKDIENRVGAVNINTTSINEQGLSYRDMAIIFRHHRQKNKVLEKVQTAGIPYELSGEVSPFHEPALQFLITTLRYLAYERDEHLQALILSLLPKGKKYFTITTKELGGIQNPVISNWYNSFVMFKQNLKPDLSNMALLLGEYLKQLQLRYNKTSLSEFLNWCADKKSLDDFLSAIEAYETNDYYDKVAEKITLTTIHSAKGLEFKVVYLLDFDADTMPGKAQGEEYNEEKRLFYVALTRAKQDAVLIKIKDKNISPFYKIIEAAGVPILNDPLINKQQHKRLVLQQKKSQIGLF